MNNFADFVNSLTIGNIYSILKYGMRQSNLPEDMTVEDMYHIIGSFYIQNG